MDSAVAKFHIQVYDTVTSTNTLLKEQAAAGAPDGTVIIAKHQTAGRGRMGRSFYSPADTGLYMSVLLRPQLKMEDALFLTTATAVAVSSAIEKTTGQQTSIKWVNDIFCHGKKVCGILTEAVPDLTNGMLKYAVIGIGVNLLPPKEGFPEELQQVATTVLSKEAKEDVVEQLKTEILNQLSIYLEQLPEKTFLEAYREKCFLIGRDVIVFPDNQLARVLGIDDMVGLIVQLDDGSQKTLRTGEVSVTLQENRQ